MIVLHLIRKFDEKIRVLFNNTLVEYPETYRFKRIIVREWKLDVIETKPTKTFWWVVDQYGFPFFSRKGHRDATKNCCRYLKEYPIEKVLRREKFDLYFTGLTRHESRLREFSARKYGPYFYSQRNNFWKCHPIQEWTEENVWEYHRIFDLPHNPFYDKRPVKGFQQRTGCWCCTIPIKYGKMEFLRINYPILWRQLLKRGLGEELIRMKTGDNVEGEHLEFLIKNRPCLFDRI